MVVGKKGETIKNLTMVLKTRFKMENPQIEVAEIRQPDLDAQAMSEYIVMMLEKYGSNRFKSVGYKALQRIIDAGAMGAEIVISGRGVPSSRAKKWRFWSGYLKKSGDVSVSKVLRAITSANLRSGTIGIKVSIMPPDLILPDTIRVKEIEQPEQAVAATGLKVEEVKAEEEKKEEKQEDKKEDKKEEKKAPKKKAPRKAPKKKEEKAEEKKEAKAEEKSAGENQKEAEEAKGQA